MKGCMTKVVAKYCQANKCCSTTHACLRVAAPFMLKINKNAVMTDKRRDKNGALMKVTRLSLCSPKTFPTKNEMLRQTNLRHVNRNMSITIFYHGPD